MVLLQFFSDYGDIIKETLSRSKLISPVQSAKTVCLSLQQVCSHKSITSLSLLCTVMASKVLMINEELFDCDDNNTAL